MPKTARPRRSVLYMPGSNARALEKAKAIAADGLILDLEDAVAPGRRLVAADVIFVHAHHLPHAVDGADIGRRVADLPIAPFPDHFARFFVERQQ